MSEIVTRSDVHQQPGQKQSEQKRDTRALVKRIAGYTIAATAAAFFAVHVANAVGVQDKYTLVSPSGIGLADFRGYEDWAVISTAHTDDVLKAIVGNPAIIKAYKGGTPGNGQAFPEGSKIVKIQWKPKKSTEAPFVVDVPDVLAQLFVMEKDSKKFPKNGGGWGYAVFNYDAKTDKFSPDATSLSNCGNACHTAVKAKDYIFHPYQKR